MAASVVLADSAWFEPRPAASLRLSSEAASASPRSSIMALNAPARRHAYALLGAALLASVALYYAAPISRARRRWRAKQS